MERKTLLDRSQGNCTQKVFGFHVQNQSKFVLLKSIYSEFRAECIKPTLLLNIFLILRTSITIVYVRASAVCAELTACVETDMSDIASSFIGLQTTLHTKYAGISLSVYVSDFTYPSKCHQTER